MAFVRQSSGGRFVAWGKENAKENSYVVNEKKYIDCYVQTVKMNERFGVILEVKTKDCIDTLLITGTTILNRELGYEWDNPDDKGNPDLLLKIEECQADYRVKSNDHIRIHFDGMLKTKKGKDAYNLYVEVDRPDK